MWCSAMMLDQEKKRMTVAADRAPQHLQGVWSSPTDPAPQIARARLLFSLGLVLLSGCSDQGPTGPGSSSECGGALASLGVLESATLDCSNGGTTITLAGGGASYLVVPQFAAGGVPKQAVGYTIGVSGGSVATASIQRGGPSGAKPPGVLAPGPWAQARPSVTPGFLQRQFDGMLRASARAGLARGRWRVPSSARHSISSSRALSLQPPALGSLNDFHVLASLDTVTPPTKRVTARLDYVGQNLLVYVDTLAPANGFTPEQLTGFGQLFDQTLYPLDLDTFGSPSDIDQNTRVIMLLSPVVNGLTSASQCASQGYIAGFFDGFDLGSTDTSSNQGEIFYSLVPDPSGTVSCAHSVNSLLANVPSVFLHEVQHLISYSQHVLVHGGTPEEGWLDEGMSLVASELGSLYYEKKFPPPTGRTEPNQLFPDSSEGFLREQLTSSYAYLLAPDTVTLTLHSDADFGLTWRGGDWLLLRWLGDQKGTGFYKQLEQSHLTGTANIAAAAGEPFASLFGDFSLALYTDSLPGVLKSSIPPRDRFTTRTLRQLYQAYFNAAGPSGSVPRPFPIVPSVLTGSVSATMVPGTPTFYQVNTAGSAAQVQIQFTSPGGSAVAGSLHPQVSVFRLQGL
jgi:hypothetical protein